MTSGPATRKQCEPLRDRDKKTDVVEHPQVFDHVGLLVNWPPGTAELPFI